MTRALAKGDTVQILAYQSSGAALNVSAIQQSSRVEIARVGD